MENTIFVMEKIYIYIEFTETERVCKVISNNPLIKRVTCQIHNSTLENFFCKFN